ncbi:MAG: response regulator transcription factor [Bacteroidetes bacterium]|nr:response regulator transcription factor [Bacteroidota bacterium]MCW5897200.1 response regulator transcription factor [Bacteroidota bacterium]
MKPIRVVIVEDHDDFREGLVHVLNFTEGFTSVGSFSNIEDALADFPDADVVLLDIHLPGKSGTESIADIKRLVPSASIIMLTVFDDDENVFRAIVNGADGYILKKTPPAHVLIAIQDAAAGGAPMTPYIARRVIELFKHYAPTGKENYSLTKREVEILQKLVLGLDNREIGDKLFISPETVRNHIKHIYEKLHVHSKSQAVVKAIKQGLV